MISLIVAMDRNRNIGLNGDIPWGKEMKSDLRRFKRLTLCAPIIMGRKTFESLPGVLIARPHIVITRDKDYKHDHPRVKIVHSVEEAIDALKEFRFAHSLGVVGTQIGKEFEAFVIGGAQIYEQFLPYADKIYITKVLAHLEGDTKFPEITGNWDIAQGMLHLLDGDKYSSQYLMYTRRA